ncbi:hypothetical protein HQ531_10035 [bacterium]|nr:hypothetical protein [bacterium]
MINTRLTRITLFFILTGLAFGQFNLSGEIMPGAMFRISNAELIDLPFRLGNVSLNYSIGDFELKTVTSIETRWKDPEYSTDMFELREAFFAWYPSFGEIKAGKMIHAWGSADANNPTDNLSPYDFYYMFLTGTDRKLGNLGILAKTYYEDWQAEAVFTPEHLANRLPFDEPEFPISFPFEPESYLDVESASEYGIRIQRAFNSADVSFSYLKGHDHLFSLLKMENPYAGAVIPRFGYRNTNVIGLDFVAFPGNWTLRGEGAMFSTESPDPDPEDFLTFPVEAEYFQYVLQVEYEFANQVSFMGQLLGTKVSTAQGLLANPANPSQPQELDTDNFTPGLGTPFAMISNQVVILSTMATVYNNSLELKGMLMVNLEETGYMTNLGASYSISDGLNLDATLGYFIGGDEPENRFKELEDFSNLNLALSFSF